MSKEHLNNRYKDFRIFFQNPTKIRVASNVRKQQQNNRNTSEHRAKEFYVKLLRHS